MRDSLQEKANLKRQRDQALADLGGPVGQANPTLKMPYVQTLGQRNANIEKVRFGSSVLLRQPVLGKHQAQGTVACRGAGRNASTAARFLQSRSASSAEACVFRAAAKAAHSSIDSPTRQGEHKARLQVIPLISLSHYDCVEQQ